MAFVERNYLAEKRGAFLLAHLAAETVMHQEREQIVGLCRLVVPQLLRLCLNVVVQGFVQVDGFLVSRLRFHLLRTEGTRLVTLYSLAVLQVTDYFQDDGTRLVAKVYTYTP